MTVLLQWLDDSSATAAGLLCSYSGWVTVQLQWCQPLLGEPREDAKHIVVAYSLRSWLAGFVHLHICSASADALPSHCRSLQQPHSQLAHQVLHSSPVSGCCCAAYMPAVLCEAAGLGLRSSRRIIDEPGRQHLGDTQPPKDCLPLS